jgi:5-methylcytosine-specific restriction protein A
MAEGRVSVGGIEFVPDDLYVRRWIHERLGGQWQGGISTPATHPVILIFTSESGREHGYGYDSWQSRELFHYTGEGQRAHGDMQFSRGNKAIRDHVQDGKRLLLFEQVRPQSSSKRMVKFVGEMACRGYHMERRDSEGYPREVIVFELVPGQR